MQDELWPKRYIDLPPSQGKVMAVIHRRLVLHHDTMVCNIAPRLVKNIPIRLSRKRMMDRA